MRGNVPNPSIEEIRALKSLRQNNRRKFDSDPNNARRLEMLERLRYNHKRSTDMGSKLESIGLSNNSVNNNKIYDALLDAGRKATPDNRTVTFILEGSTGRLKVRSTWTILPGGERYLSTFQLIPID